MINLRAGLLIALIHFALSFFLPWWTIIFISFIVVALFKLPSKAAWLSPSIFIMLSWLLQILYLDQKTGFRSSERIADIFGAPAMVSYIIAIITIGLVAGLSGYLAFLIFGRRMDSSRIDEYGTMSIEEYKENTPGLEDKGII